MIKKWNNYIREAKSMRTFKIEANGSKDLSTTNVDIEKRAKELVEQNIDLIFNKLHQEFKTDSGDISPSQASELDNLQESLGKPSNSKHRNKKYKVKCYRCRYTRRFRHRKGYKSW